MSKYQVGDRLFIKDGLLDCTYYDGILFVESMRTPQVVQIKKVIEMDDRFTYQTVEHGSDLFTECMFEGLVTDVLSRGKIVITRDNTDNDGVIHPNHYNKGAIECVDAIKSAITDMPATPAFFTGQVIKYMWRWWWKNGKKDLLKAKYYIELLLQGIEKGEYHDGNER